MWQDYTQGEENLHAQTSWGDKGTKTKIYCHATICWTCNLQCHRPSKWL